MPDYIPVVPAGYPSEVPTRERFDTAVTALSASVAGVVDVLGYPAPPEDPGPVHGRLVTLETASPPSSGTGERLDALEAVDVRHDESLDTHAQWIGAAAPVITGHAAAIDGLNAAVGMPYTEQPALKARVSALEQLGVGAPQNQHTEEIIIRPGANMDADMQAALALCYADRIGGTGSRYKIVLVPNGSNGTFVFTTPACSPGQAFGQVNGMRIMSGLGPGSVRMDWRGNGAWLDTTQTRFRDLQISGINFNGDSTSRELIKNISTSGIFNNRWRIYDCNASGSWSSVIRVTTPPSGVQNLASENEYERFSSDPSAIYGNAFFRVDTGCNQSLGHSFRDCHLSLTRGKIWSLASGGGFSVYGGSCSAADNTNGPITWLDLPGANSNNPKVNQYLMQDVFFEPKRYSPGDGSPGSDTSHRILDCGRADGLVKFVRCEHLSSLQQDPATTVNGYKLVRISPPAPWGSGTGAVSPVVVFEGHTGVGQIEVVLPGMNQTRGGIVLRDTTWYRGVNQVMADLVGGASPILAMTGGTARYASERNANIPSVSNWN